MLYFTGEVFCRLANQNRGHIRVMLEYTLIIFGVMSVGRPNQLKIH